ncbi:MAG: (d)CMP kinase [Alphaproteobacteria bacterium]|nr:(d)CMP kinase [Alphaproteobacteria bacterium]
MIIAIDGSSASGKGTLSANLMKYYDAAYLDTGALYRAVGLMLLERGDSPDDAEMALEAALMLSSQEMLSLQKNPDLRTQEVASAASKVSVIPAVRRALFDFQRDFALHPVKEDGTPVKVAILDGRDIGTVVCPDADIKLFLTASAEVRAKRRLKDLQLKGISAIYETVLSEIRERDERDAKRAIAPSKPAEDALVLDTSDMKSGEVLEKVLAYIKEKTNK